MAWNRDQAQRWLANTQTGRAVALLQAEVSRLDALLERGEACTRCPRCERLMPVRMMRRLGKSGIQRCVECLERQGVEGKEWSRWRFLKRRGAEQ